MNDPIAEAAEALNQPQQSAPEVAQVGEQSQSEIQPGSALDFASAEQSTSMNSNGSACNTVAAGMSGAGEAGEPSSSPSSGGSGTAEHPHTSILRRMTETLRRKWNVFDGELEAILKDAESHL